MQVSFFNNINVNFRARNERIRKADDIMRAAKNEFPVVSSSRIADISVFSDYDSIRFRDKLFDRFRNRIKNIRDIYQSKDLYCPYMRFTDEEKNTPNAVLLKLVKRNRLGNCAENADMALSALAANGFYDSKTVNLYLKTQVIDNNTGKVVREKLDELDHCFVLTSLGEYSNDERDIIVVDPWLGFSDTYANAMVKFKELYGDEILEDYAIMHKKLYGADCAKKGRFIDLYDYSTNQKFVCVTCKLLTEKEMQKMGHYVKNEYPSLVS